MKQTILSALILSSTLFNTADVQGGIVPNSLSQTIYLTQQVELFDLDPSIDLRRAQNLARQAAENANGGLGTYRAEASMHGIPEGSPYVENSDGSWTFTFQGRRPNSSNYTLETVVTVTQTGEARIDYNGRIQNSQLQAQSDLETPNIDLKRAQNLARQAAENANGGLGEYRAESSMHGATVDAPVVENADGSWTFTFQGRRPESSNYTMESVVTVTSRGNIKIEYNGGIR